MSLRSRFFRFRSLRDTAHRAVKLWALAVFAVHVGTVATIIVNDQFRKRRIPCGREGFPHLPPLSTHLADNEVTVYTDGEALYTDMLQAINTAQHTIYFETFIWKGDTVGQQFKDALIAARPARAGTRTPSATRS